MQIRHAVNKMALSSLPVNIHCPSTGRFSYEAHGSDNVQDTFLDEFSPSFKMDCFAAYVVALWEDTPTFSHRATIQSIGLDLMREFGVCDQALLVSVSYLQRLRRTFDASGIHTRHCSAQLFTVALLVACKFLYDISPANPEWAIVAHFDRRHVNDMEKELLDALDFNMCASPEDTRLALNAILEYNRETLECVETHRQATTMYPSPPSSGRSTPYREADCTIFASFESYLPWSDGSNDSIHTLNANISYPSPCSLASDTTFNTFGCSTNTMAPPMYSTPVPAADYRTFHPQQNGWTPPQSHVDVVNHNFSLFGNNDTTASCWSSMDSFSSSIYKQGQPHGAFYDHASLSLHVAPIYSTCYPPIAENTQAPSSQHMYGHPRYPHGASLSSDRSYTGSIYAPVSSHVSLFSDPTF